VVAAHPPTAATEALAAGASDVAWLPAIPAVLAARCRNLVRLGRKDGAGAPALEKINEVLTASGDDAEALVHVLRITASTLGFERASLIAHIEGSDHAFVIAASDAEPLQRFTLAIAAYPEIREAIRTVQPVLIDLDPEIEEAAASLGANRWHTVFRVILPSLIPALLTGFALAFARAIGEYGSVIFIAGNLPNVSEIAPLLIVIRLSEFRYADATAIAVVMLVASFLIIFLINRLQRWAQARIPVH